MTVEKDESTMTVSSQWIRALLQAAAVMGLDRELLRRKADVAEDTLNNPVCRISMTNTLRLWRSLEELCPLDLGVQLGQHLSPAHFPLLSMNLMHCETLMEVLAVASRYSPLVSEGAGFQVRGAINEIHICYTPRLPDFSRHQIDTVLILLLRFGTWLSCKPVLPIRVELTVAKPECHKVYEKAYGLIPIFNSAENVLVFSTDWLSERLPGGDPTLAEIHRQMIDEQLKNLQLPDTVVLMRQWLQEAPDLTLDRNVFAQRLHISGRTLQRKLQEVNTSFQQLLDEERERRAVLLLSTSKKSITEISAELGFAESSTFSRAFRRWRGASPQEFRQQQNR
ncbi:AraC family transcriptional regulator [Thalassolituus sp.]|uniref:AraC family transcriptional regulator n=1 Tax=Thalassolituus sp. TaxID=2030822 RepID=UPI002A81AA43|nr:AraC family transcriptional regulator ligand-binding domain-containing protein [Thalassolituus sp.]